MRKLLLLFFVPTGLLVAYLLFSAFLSDSLPELKKEISDYVSIDRIESLSAPPPLFGPRQDATSELTSKGVIAWTNNQRRGEGLPALQENSRLNAAASKKVADMFARQYFAHESPTGSTAKDLVAEQGYEYVLVGENLALGNYEDDQVLVQAWMDSPGHRENILKTSFEEIGVAVKKGVYEGDEVWLAVQIFARPISSCPQPEEGLLERIDLNDALLEQQYAALQTQRDDLQNYENKKSEEYAQKVDEFNQNVDAYNTLLEQQKNLVSEYNTQVQALNACIQNS